MEDKTEKPHIDTYQLIVPLKFMAKKEGRRSIVCNEQMYNSILFASLSSSLCLLEMPGCMLYEPKYGMDRLSPS
jgi:hypothetical protein